MKAALFDGSRKIMVDTRHDACLVSEIPPKPKSSDIQVFGRELYLHTDQTRNRKFYFHIRPVGIPGRDKVVPVSPVMAERYLLKRGITCTEFPKAEAVSRLYDWGYGIAEEF